MAKPEPTENDKAFECYARYYTLKTKNGIYAWIYDDGTERFPGVTFSSQKEATEYHDKLYPPNKFYVKFEQCQKKPN